MHWRPLPPAYRNWKNAWRGAIAGRRNMPSNPSEIEAQIEAAHKLLLHHAETQEYVVDTIFPAGAMHLLGGASGSNKTTWLFEQMYEWDQGKKLFGIYQSNRCPWVYISCDRSSRDTSQTLKRLDLLHWKFDNYALEDLLGVSKVTGHLESPDIIKHILNNPKFSHAKLIVIEGLQALMPNVPKGQSQNKAELLWAMEVRKILALNNRTIIATTHNPKQTGPGQSSSDERSKFLGSQGFIGSCSTMVGFEKDEKQPNMRNVTIMGRNFADIKQSYSIDANGKLKLEVSGGVDMNPQEMEELNFELWLGSQPQPLLVTVARDHFEKLYGSRNKFFDTLKALRAEGKIVTEKDGSKYAVLRYSRPSVQ